MIDRISNRNRRSFYNQIAANDCWGGRRWYGLYRPYELGNSSEYESREDASLELHRTLQVYQSRERLEFSDIGPLRLIYVSILGSPGRVFGRP